MPILVFRHTLSDAAGLIGGVLDVRGIEWRYVDCWDSPEAGLSIETADALIVMGGAMSVNDPLPWLRLEEQQIVRAISSGVPVLGVCLGAQLLAKCLGGTVRPMGHKEIGWFPVRLTDEGQSDPLFQGLPVEETFFHWHGENFSMPAGAERLAESRLCPNQAFRSGSNLYGLQFHPEVTPEIIRSWCREDEACGDQREADGEIDPEAYQDRMREVSSVIFGRWCDLVVTR